VLPTVGRERSRPQANRDRRVVSCRPTNPACVGGGLDGHLEDCVVFGADTGGSSSLDVLLAGAKLKNSVQALISTGPIGGRRVTPELARAQCRSDKACEPLRDEGPGTRTTTVVVTSPLASALNGLVMSTRIGRGARRLRWWELLDAFAFGNVDALRRWCRTTPSLTLT
jgi:hypothetical protein